MPIHAGSGFQGVEEPRGLGAAAKSVAERASALARLELELAALELKRKIASLGIGIGLGVGAALFAVFGLAFTFLAIGAVIDIWLPRWAALFIVAGILFGLVALLGLLAMRAIKKGTPPLPEQAIEEAKLTTAALKAGHDGG